MTLDALLAPVEGDDPCGVDLSFSREFDAIAESRRADDPTLAQGEWKKPLKAADWPGVAQQCEALLRRRAKDLRVAVWLTEALTRTRGFAGLADGLGLCAALCETWWDAGLHPRSDDGDSAPRVGCLDRLLAQAADSARSAPVLRDGDVAVDLRDIDAARALQSAIARGAVDADSVKDQTTLDDVTRIEAGTPPAFFAQNRDAVREAVAALARLQAVVDRRLGDDGPTFGAARKALDDVLVDVERLAGADAPASPPAVGPEAVAYTAERSPPGPLQTRAQALQQLRAVAEFFRRTEPHSPVAYLADKAAAWGEMPLHDWLREVLKDPGALAQVEDVLGVPRAPG